MAFSNLRTYIDALQKSGDVCEISAEVDPNLEVAEIHRRVISEEGPALLFKNVKGSDFPIVTNLFGTKERIDLAFGSRGPELVQQAASLPEELLPPSIQKLWKKKSFFKEFLSVGLKQVAKAPVAEVSDHPPNLDALPVITSWSEDGGPFFTLPLVYTEHPASGVPNLGMYRMQRFSSSETGMHMQIGKGGGFHLAAAKERNESLPLNVFLGGPPAAILSAIAPLPENVPELMLASLVLGQKVQLAKNKFGPLPLLAEAEFVLVGSVNPNEMRPEGPFGDHYGYYSLTHDFPVFHCDAVLRRKDAIYPATIVGKPRQEDFYIGDYLQELLAPLFPIVMPAVRDLWSYGETGYHSLATAVVRERYKREAMVSAFRILGEGQLSLTKFLLVIDKPMDLKNFPEVLQHVLERVDFRSDLYVFSNLSMDTLDYCGPTINEGSKGVMLGVGDPIRQLPREFSGELPQDITSCEVYCPGCLVISGPSITDDPEAGARLAQVPAFSEWPLIILSDNAKQCAQSDASFLWNVFTRFEPAADLYGKRTFIHRFHLGIEAPLLIDCRLASDFPDELFCDEQTSKLVDERWSEYGITI